MKPKDNEANLANKNVGTDGTNRQYDQNQGNRGKQLNRTPNDANGGSSPSRKRTGRPAGRRKAT